MRARMLHESTTTAKRRFIAFGGKMRFRLRTLFVVLTAVCIGLGYVGWRMRSAGDFRAGVAVTMDLSDSRPISKRVRARTGDFPCHKTVVEAGHFLDDGLVAEYSTLDEITIGDNIFYDVTLSDGSETQVGFWTYEGRDTAGTQRVEVVCVLAGYDTPAEVLTGVADKRRRERSQLLQKYTERLSQIRRLTAGRHVLPDGSLSVW